MIFCALWHITPIFLVYKLNQSHGYSDMQWLSSFPPIVLSWFYDALRFLNISAYLMLLSVTDDVALFRLLFQGTFAKAADLITQPL